MKKTKLLTSLSALVLALSVTACGGSSSEEPEPEPEPVTSIANLTLSFSFTSGDSVASLPENASAYVIGGWDSWGEFLLLGESEGVYSYTFDEIGIGTFEYKVVMWYVGEPVSWSNCVEITTTNQKVEILEEDEGGVKEISLVCNATLPELGEIEGNEANNIATAILEAVPADKDISEIWDAVHVSSVDSSTWGSTKEIYLSVEVVPVEQWDGSYEDTDYLTGFVYEKDAFGGEGPTFYKNGAKFSQETSYDYSYGNGEEYTGWKVAKNSSTFKSVISDESGALAAAATLAEGEPTFTLTRGVNTYTLVIAVEEDEEDKTYTFITDWNYDLIGYAFEGKELTFSAEKSTAAAVKEATDTYQDEEFGVYLTPGDVMRGEKDNTNYYTYFAYQPTIGSNSVKWGAYKAAQEKAEAGDSSDLEQLESTLNEEGIGFWYQDDIYYTDDAVLVVHSGEIYSTAGSGVNHDTFEVLVNENGEVKDYTSEDGDTWTLESTREGSWKDYYYYLGTGYDLGADEGFTLNSASTSRADDTSYGNWTIDQEHAGAYFKAMGGDAMDVLSKEDIDEYAELVEPYGNTSFYQYNPSNQYLNNISFYIDRLIWFDDELTDETDIYRENINFNSYIAKFGTINIEDALEMAIYNKNAENSSDD